MSCRENEVQFNPKAENGELEALAVGKACYARLYIPTPGFERGNLGLSPWLPPEGGS